MSDARPEHSAGETAADPTRPDAPPPAPPAATAADETPARGDGAARPLAACLAGGLVVLVAGVASSPYWAPALAPLLPWSGAAGFTDATARGQLQELSRRVAAVEQRPAASGGADAAELGKLTQRLAALEQRPAPAASGGGDADVAALREQVQREAADAAKLADRIAALEAKPAAATVDPAALQAAQSGIDALGATVRELGDRMTKLAAAPGEVRRDQALLLALGQLRLAMAGSSPFGDALAAASALAVDRPEAKAALERLAPAATSGVPSLAVLRERFERVAGTIANADAAQAPDWGDRILGTLRQAFALRRVGTAATGGSPEAAVATAEGALAAGDLAGAVAALDPLEGAAAAKARPWLAAAHRRLDAEAALAAASDSVTAHLAEAAPAGKAEQAQPAAGAAGTTN